jgi:hypothetical protein
MWECRPGKYRLLDESRHVLYAVSAAEERHARLGARLYVATGMPELRRADLSPETLQCLLNSIGNFQLDELVAHPSLPKMVQIPDG